MEAAKWGRRQYDGYHGKAPQWIAGHGAPRVPSKSAPFVTRRYARGDALQPRDRTGQDRTALRGVPTEQYAIYIEARPSYRWGCQTTSCHVEKGTHTRSDYDGPQLDVYEGEANVRRSMPNNKANVSLINAPSSLKTN